MMTTMLLLTTLSLAHCAAIFYFSSGCQVAAESGGQQEALHLWGKVHGHSRAEDSTVLLHRQQRGHVSAPLFTAPRPAPCGNRTGISDM